MHSDKERILEQRETERLVGEAFALAERLVRASSKLGKAVQNRAVDDLYLAARDLEKDNIFSEKHCMDCSNLKLYFYGTDTVQHCCGHPHNEGKEVELTGSCDLWNFREGAAIWCGDCIFFRGSIPCGKATVARCINVLAKPGIVSRRQPACPLVRVVSQQEHETIKRRLCESCRWYEATEQDRVISFKCTRMRGQTVETMPQLTCAWYEWMGRPIFPGSAGAKR